MSRLAACCWRCWPSLSLVPAAEAKKFRYSSGPKAARGLDAVGGRTPTSSPSSARAVRGCRTRICSSPQLVADSAAVARALGDRGRERARTSCWRRRASTRSTSSLEHALLNATVAPRRGRDRAPLADARRQPRGRCSRAPAIRCVEYTLGSAKVIYLRLVGWLPGRVKIERQSLVPGTHRAARPRTARACCGPATSARTSSTASPRNQVAWSRRRVTPI